MKKSVFALALCASFSLANPLEFDTLSANFTQSVQSEDAKINYTGDFSATKEHAVWHYISPTKKNIFFSFTKVTVIEPDLEQAIITNIKETPNLVAILSGAKQNKSGAYEAELDGVKYFITTQNDAPSQISYTDKLDNKVVINLQSVRKNEKIDEKIFAPNIPNHYDIITQ
ncbi:LolA-like outer membrane lipoprotein chaperone [Campylobacter sp. JMF_02 ED1]|uniref:LolA-like outer membrane lipoprotein chaperone n=1 Tax=unclassified Campylobacter TaxID=2593542 RepID=UPI0022E9F8BE|nr:MULTISPECIES: LolA-like outer membrane lipoprotein chaperone [unclassified Campylobacter]MDA3049286.1 LolA-like outer membrane lipoprotein chaperone [Campylobacter sp. JMF_15 NE4]MDA3051289.1 LolA-like outer membrane lipoprotein chaperone [Campylobacter sp. JMF_02 ED1]